MAIGNLSDVQNDIYLRGLAGARPELPLTAEGLEARAREVMTPEAFAYVAGGAGAEHTMRANLDAFAGRRIVPRMLREVTAREGV
jgi:lactate 2-monooxygenase